MNYLHPNLSYVVLNSLYSGAHILQIRIVLFHKFTILHAPITKIAEQKKMITLLRP